MYFQEIPKIKVQNLMDTPLLKVKCVFACVCRIWPDVKVGKWPKQASPLEFGCRVAKLYYMEYKRSAWNHREWEHYKNAKICHIELGEGGFLKLIL